MEISEGVTIKLVKGSIVAIRYKHLGFTDHVVLSQLLWTHPPRKPLTQFPTTGVELAVLQLVVPDIHLTANLAAPAAT